LQAASRSNILSKEAGVFDNLSDIGKEAVKIGRKDYKNRIF
jgi:hypothetical protein